LTKYKEHIMYTRIKFIFTDYDIVNNERAKNSYTVCYSIRTMLRLERSAFFIILIYNDPFLFTTGYFTSDGEPDGIENATNNTFA
jgi:hypothetical protein